MYEKGKVKPPLSVWQTAAIALIEWACGYDVGRSKDDPVYKLVTENRDGPGPEQRKKYSSCGDVVHFYLMRLGVRESWINRTDDGVYGPWVSGKNISDLWGSSCPIDIVPNADWKPEPGDILIIWNTGFDSHVCVALSELEQGKIVLGNYGAGGMNPNPLPGSNVKPSKLTWNGKQWVIGSRYVQRCLKLSEIVKHVSVKPDLSGGLSLIGEVMDALEFGVDPE